MSCQVCGPTNVPITTADQGYLDFNASWQMNARTQLFVQAYNLTEEEIPQLRAGQTLHHVL